MYTIAFYISDHGFGHASRNIPIIRYILTEYDDVKVIMKAGKSQGKFIMSLLRDFRNRIEYYFEPMDIGLILKEGSLDIDKEKLEGKVTDYINSWEGKIGKEIEFLHYNNVNLTVSDIVPWIFKASNMANIPSILISNFAWVDIYKEHLSGCICDEYKKCYELCTKALFYEFYMEDMKEYIRSYEKVSLCAREFSKDKADKIKQEFNNPLVFISVGRSVELKEEIDVSSMNYDFIVTEGIKLKGNNVYYLTKETENTHDYIMASDYIISKAGWGTVSEVVLAKKRCALIGRDSIAEDRNTINKMVCSGLAIEVNLQEGLQNILNKMDKLELSGRIYMYRNDYKTIGDKVIKAMKEGVGNGEE